MALVEDVYTTRVSGRPRVIDRPDPVFWGRPDTPEYADFDRRGFLQREAVIDEDDVATCLTEIDRIQRDPALRDDERIVREAGSDAVRSIFEILELSDAVRRVVESSGAYDIAREILGSDVYIHQSRLNYKPGFQGGAFYWHSDFETWHAEDGMADIRAVSCSIALTRNYPYNGSLMVIPGSHHTFYPCVGATPDNHHGTSLIAQQVGTPDETTLSKAVDHHGIDQFTGPPGTALWFDANLLHGSGSNITPLPRSNVFLVFNSVHNRLGEPFAAPRPRPRYLAAR